MKRISLYLLGITCILAGCQKKSDDLINGQSVDQRLTAALAAYQTVLTTAPYGWILLENSAAPNNGGQGADNLNVTFAYYMQFNNSNQVVQFSDFDTNMLVKADTSSYRLKAMQRPTLIFDTYSYIHVPCDPDPNVSKTPLINTLGPGAGGLGWGTDFEFEISDNIDASKLGDTIHLNGLANQAQATLVKATKAQHDSYFNGTAKNAIFLNKILNYFKRVTSTGATFEITPAAADNSSPSGVRNVDVTIVSGGRINTIVSNISYVGNSIHFANPIGGVVSSIDNITWNPATATATGTVLGTPATVAGAIAPVKNDTTAPFNWWFAGATSDYGYWANSNGFHINGVDNALNFVPTGNPPYAGVIAYLPVVDTIAGTSPRTYYGAFAPITVENGGGSLDFGLGYAGTGTQNGGVLPTPPAFRNGLFYFTYLHNYFPATSGFTSIPTGWTSSFSAMRNVLESAGYYLILKDDGVSYDMVIASDAKTWMQWRVPG